MTTNDDFKNFYATKEVPKVGDLVKSLENELRIVTEVRLFIHGWTCVKTASSNYFSYAVTYSLIARI